MGNEYSSFERIPFASPPIGTLRFGSPQPNKRKVKFNYFMNN